MKGIILWIISTISILVFLISVTGCSEDQSPKQTIISPKITLGVGTGLFLSSIWVAENKGYFQEEGLDLTIKEFATGKASFKDMLNGGVDISTAAPSPIVFSSFIRKDFSIFATIASSDDNIKVIVNKEKGVTTVDDLKGKKIGTVLGTSSQFFLATFLTYKGLPETDIEMIDINPKKLPNALNSGEVDAIVIWEPIAHNAQKLLGDKAILLASSEVYRETFNVLVMKDFAQKSPEVLKRFIKAIDRATTFINTNKEEAQSVVSERINLDKKLVALHWNDIFFDVSLSQTLLLTLEVEARWAVKNKLTLKNKIPNYLDFIYPEAIKAIKPEAISIIR